MLDYSKYMEIFDHKTVYIFFLNPLKILVIYIFIHNNMLIINFYNNYAIFQMRIHCVTLVENQDKPWNNTLSLFN